MSTSANIAAGNGWHRHPPGLYVLFLTEMWERFSFYTMGAMFTLYLRDSSEGFGWTAAEATTLYANYAMCVYASPLIGGILANWKLGYRLAVMIGGFFFMAGHLILSVPALWAVYSALTCLVIGNGLFKPNISAMVGSIYPPGSHLKERAYNIFYMGINIGAFLAPVTAEIVKGQFGFHIAFAVAAGGMVISVATLWIFRKHVEDRSLAPSPAAVPSSAVAAGEPPMTAPPRAIDLVPDWQRIGALIVVFLIVIVFWMVFHQNHTTITYWANENTDWQVSGILSSAINAFWVVALTFPLIYFWKLLDRMGLEPSTPTKMMLGMVMTGCAFLVFYVAALQGEATATDEMRHEFKVSPLWLIGAYAVLTLGELMLSPMGLALVSKVSPPRFAGIMMGGWFVATAIGNKLTQIGVYWQYWYHSTFWLVLSLLAFSIAVVTLLLLIPLKKAMPGV